MPWCFFQALREVLSKDSVQGMGESDEQQEQAQGSGMHNICSVSDVIGLQLVKSAKRKGDGCCRPLESFRPVPELQRSLQSLTLS